MRDVVVRSNLPEFKRQLDTIKVDMQRRAVRRATAAVGRIFRNEAKRISPVLQTMRKHRVMGALRKNIIVKRSRYQRVGAERYFVGVRSGKVSQRASGDPFYWRFLEGGWMPRGAGRRLKGGNRSRALQRSRSRSAGGSFVQFPFLAPAFNSKRTEALQAFSDAIARAVAGYSKIK
jgi:HK97 gp10 family phage protein